MPNMVMKTKSENGAIDATSNALSEKSRVLMHSSEGSKYSTDQDDYLQLFEPLFLEEDGAFNDCLMMSDIISFNYLLQGG